MLRNFLRPFTKENNGYSINTISYVIFVIFKRHFEDFEKRIPRSEMEKLEKVALKHINDIDSEYQAQICGSYRRGKTISQNIQV